MYSSLVVLIWFRGISFFIKMEDVEEFEMAYEIDKDEAMKEILV